MADLGGGEAPELAAFRAEARSWLEANVPASVRGVPMTIEQMEGGGEFSADEDAWRQRIGERGWGTPTWQKAYGGGGLTSADARVLRQEMARIGADNPIVGMGPGMFGATLLEYGTEAQKRRHLPPICRGELRWCQGFSEPGAGSDLASLTTKAEDRGDHWLVNGQKVWTSGGQYADWCFCLVRTDPTRKHEGISFVLIDMESAGIEVRPIQLISGSSPFCETFFLDVKVPKENLVGKLNEGWTITKRLLQHEREGMGTRPRSGGEASLAVEDVAKRFIGLDAQGRIADPDLRSRIIRHRMGAQTVSQLVQRVAAEAKSSQGPGAATSVMKNAMVKVQQDRSELLVEIMGYAGLGWEGEGFSADALQETREWLSGKASSIYGGSSEIQNNIIAKRILGLLDHQ